MAGDSSILNLAKQGSITLSGRIFGKVLNFLFLMYVTRVVSDQAYGLFALGISISALTFSLASGALHRAIDYFIPQYLSSDDFASVRGVILKTLLIGGAVSTTVAMLMFVFSAEIGELFDNRNIVPFIPFFAILIPVNFVYKLILRVSAGIKEMRYQVYIDNFSFSISRLGITALLLAFGYGPLGLIAGHIGGIAIAIVIGTIILFSQQRWMFRPSVSSVSTKKILSYTVPLSVAAVVYSTVSHVDYLMVGYFKSAADLGRYRVAFMFASNLLLFITALTPIYKPIISENMDDPEILGKMYRTATRWILLLTLPPAITIASAPVGYMELFFTSEFSTSQWVVTILVLGYVLNAALGPEGTMLEALGRSRLLMANTVIMLTANLLVNVALIPRYGIVGAAIGTAVAYFVTSFLGMIEIFYIYGTHPYTSATIKTAVSSVPAVLATVLVSSTLEAGVVTLTLLPFVSLVSFYSSQIVLGGFAEEDLDIAQRADNLLGTSIFERVVKYSQG